MSYQGSKGLIFVDAKKKRNAYEIRGLYSLSDNSIILNGALFKNKDKLGNFIIPSSSIDLEEIFSKIIIQVNRIISEE